MRWSLYVDSSRQKIIRVYPDTMSEREFLRSIAELKTLAVSSHLRGPSGYGYEDDSIIIEEAKSDS